MELLLFFVLILVTGLLRTPKGPGPRRGNARDWSPWGELQRSASSDPDELRYRRTVIRTSLAYTVILPFGTLAIVYESMLTAPYLCWGVLVPLALLSPRSGVVVNRRDRVITRWWGPFFPLVHRTEPVSHGTLLILTTRELERHETYWSLYTLTVEMNASESFRIPTRGARDDTHPVAEEIAGFLGLQLIDRTTATEVVHTPAELLERLARRGVSFAALDSPAPPA